MKMLLNLEVEVGEVLPDDESTADIQTYQKGVDWPVGVIPMPGVGDTVVLTPGLARAAGTDTADVISRVFYPEGLIVKDASIGVVHVVLVLSSDDHTATARDQLEKSGWRVAGV